MNKTLRKTSPLLGGLALLTFGVSAATAQFGNLMLENWDAAPLGDLESSEYTGNWSDVGFHSVWPDGHSQITPVNSVAEIRTDDANVFGRGTSNQILALEEAAGITFTFDMPAGHEVATLSYETLVTGFTYHDDPEDPRDPITNRFTNRFFTDDGTAINHGLQRLNDDEFRLRNEPDAFDLGEFYHFDAIVNNSADTITYNTPTGTATLDAGLTAVWINGEFGFDYDFGQTDDLPAGEFTSVVLETFSNNTWSAYYDNVAITEGAFVIPEPSTYALLAGFGVLGIALVVRRRRRQS